MKRKGLLTVILLVVTVGLAGGAIYIGSYLSKQQTTPNNINAGSPSGAAACADAGMSNNGWGVVCDQVSECSAGQVYGCTVGCEPSSYYDACLGTANEGAYCDEATSYKKFNPGDYFMGCGGDTGRENCYCTQLTHSYKVSCYSQPTSCVGRIYVSQITDTDTPIPTETSIPTNTPTTVPTNTPIPTNTLVPSNTPTVTPTGTVPFTHTPTITPTRTTPFTRTPTATPTNTPTGTVPFTHTPTNTPTGTVPFTNTPTITPTGTVIVTPSLPHTAIISDKYDMMIFGALLFASGVIIFALGYNEKVGIFFYNLVGRKSFTNKRYFEEDINNVIKTVENKPKKKNKRK